MTTKAARERRNAMVVDLLPQIRLFTFWLSRSYPMHMDREDILAAVHLAVVEAAARWRDDDVPQVPLMAFLSPRIRGAVRDYGRAQDWMSRNDRTLVTKVHRMQQAHSTEVEICRVLNIDHGRIVRLEAAYTRSRLLSVEASQVDLVSSAGTEDAAMVSAMRPAVGVALAKLSENERYVVVQWFWMDRKMKAIGGDMHLTEARVSQLRKQALGKMGRSLGPQA